MAKDSTPDYGTFEKDGKTRVASDQAEAVRLRFAGWAEKKSGKASAASSSAASS